MIVLFAFFIFVIWYLFVWSCTKLWDDVDETFKIYQEREKFWQAMSQTGEYKRIEKIFNDRK